MPHERTSDTDVFLFVIVSFAVMVVLFLMAGCGRAVPPHPSCQESVEPLSMGFGARCAIGASMVYVEHIDGGMRFDEANPWAGGYIVCRCTSEQ